MNKRKWVVELKTDKLYKKQVWEGTELLSMERQNNSSPTLIRRGYFASLWTTGLENWTPLTSLFYASNESVKLTSEFKRNKPIGCVRPFPQKYKEFQEAEAKAAPKVGPV